MAKNLTLGMFADKTKERIAKHSTFNYLKLGDVQPDLLLRSDVNDTH